jgi:hypothetical protein
MDIDVILKVWVPVSHVLVGQVSLLNNSGSTQNAGVEWLVLLDPIASGKPMTIEQMGINKVICGRSGDLHPLLYLSGGPEESSSAHPGLAVRSILLPGERRQVTWVLAAEDSPEASLQAARHYSSRQLDIEQLKLEMEDRRHFVSLNRLENINTRIIKDTQIQAAQLVMPGSNLLKHHTFLLERTPLSPSSTDAKFLHLHPGWAGQTLPALHLISQVLLPGYPALVKEFIENELEAQQEDGSIDVSVNTNRQGIGVLALPFLCSLVESLIPYITDRNWLSEMYPRLEKFVSVWAAMLTNTGEKIIFDHPQQVGFFDEVDNPTQALKNLWLKMASGTNPFLLSLLFKEMTSLSNVARRLGFQPPDWIADTIDSTKQILENLWDEQTATFGYLDILSGKRHAGGNLAEFSQNGRFSCPTRFRSPNTLFISIDHEVPLPPELKITVSGRMEGRSEKIIFVNKDFQRLGDSSFVFIRRPFSSVSSILVEHAPEIKNGQFGIVDLSQSDITSFMPLWAGYPNPDQVEALLESNKIREHLNDQGLWMNPIDTDLQNERVPDFLASFIIEGLFNYGQRSLALDIFNKHYLSDYAISLRVNSQGYLRSLIPLRLYLKLIGIHEFLPGEVILESFNAPIHPVTVQYGQVELTVTSNRTTFTVQGIEPVVIDTPGLKRVRMNDERRMSK